MLVLITIILKMQYNHIIVKQLIIIVQLIILLPAFGIGGNPLFFIFNIVYIPKANNI